MQFTEFNLVSQPEAFEGLMKCCGSKKWANAVSKWRPYNDFNDLILRSERLWFALEETDWLEAFSHHPPIGADLSALRVRFAQSVDWATEEQGGVRNASEPVLESLAQGNERYLKKFGYVFLICATGKSADEMLASLNQRMENDLEVELRLAAEEQAKITRIRLEKWL